MSTPQRSVLLVEPSSQNIPMTMNEKLYSNGIKVSDNLESLDGVVEKLSALTPDILVLSVPFLDHGTLESLQAISSTLPTPVLLVAQQHAPESFARIVGAGISSYIVDDISAHRLPLILELAIERFQQMRSLNEELDAAKERLYERKLIEKAKGILMEQKSLSESEAYTQMRSLAMNQGKSMKDLSAQIISVVELFE
ncbi:MAG: ANTAR domain-containing protein [Gammaproteobacteria bacterium]|nr:ANTAR domain-containing protein [Gammaproteobacteria bacterium]